MKLLRKADVQHLSTRQRTYIRYSSRTEHALARTFGVSVATIRKVRATADRDHPARIANAVRREQAVG